MAISQKRRNRGSPTPLGHLGLTSRVFLQHVWNGYLRLTEVNLLLGVNKVIWDPDVGHILVTHEGICSNLSCLPGVGFSFRVDG